MKRHSWALILVLLTTVTGAQTFPQPQYFRSLFTSPQPPRIAGPEGLQDYVSDGKLRLTLQDAVRLALLNDTDVRLNRLDVDTAWFATLRAYQKFDPLLSGSFRPSRSTSPTTSELQGATTLSDLTHQASLSYSQVLQTGTSYSVGFSSTRDSTNSSYVFVNPSFASSLNFSLTQPLLRGRGLKTNRAPIVIARRNLKQSQATLQARLNESISNVVNQYWDVVQSRQELEVHQKSVELADATYKQNKRALELGALPQLDIYRSESEVAQRKLALIQAQYRLKQLEDALRRTLGADLDPAVQGLDLELTERADNTPIRPVDPKGAVAAALAGRPELAALREQVANDDLNVQVANQNLKPDLNITGFYSSNGRGGNAYDSNGNVTPGGFWDAWDQLTGFNYPSYGMTLELRLPLRNRAAQADLGTALVGKKRTLYQIRQREQAVSLEVRNALNQLEGSAMSITAAQTAFELAKKTLAAEQRKYELGVQTIFFVLEAQTQLASAEQNLVQAQIGYRRALTALDRATAELLHSYNVQVN